MANESQTPAQASNQTQPTDNTQETLDTAAEGTDSAEQADAGAAGKADPKAQKAVTKQIQKQLKKLKLKVDGQEIEEEYDPNDDEYMTRQLQMAKVAQKRMSEFASLQKEVVKFVEDLKKNPRKALSNPDIGVDVKELAARIIEEEIAESKKSPEQIEREKLQEELQRMKEDRDREKNEAQAREMERLKQQEFERIDVQIDQALQTTDLPKEPYVVKKIAEYMLLAYQEGKDVTPADVLPLVRDEILSDIKHLAEVLPEDALQEIFGDVIKKVRKANVAKAKQKVAVGNNKALDMAKKLEDASKPIAKKKTFKEFFGV